MLFTALLAEFALITVRAFKSPTPHPPLPSELEAAVAIFGLLSLFGSSEGGQRFAGTVAWGLVIATAFQVLPTGPGSTNTATAPSSKTAPVQARPGVTNA